MKKMDVTELLESEFLCVEFIQKSNTKKGVILSSGTQELSKDGKVKQLQVLLEIDGKKKYWKINKTSLKRLKEKFGTESENFVGKQVGFEVAMLQGGREGIIGTPLV